MPNHRDTRCERIPTSPPHALWETLPPVAEISKLLAKVESPSIDSILFTPILHTSACEFFPTTQLCKLRVLNKADSPSFDSNFLFRSMNPWTITYQKLCASRFRYRRLLDRDEVRRLQREVAALSRTPRWMGSRDEGKGHARGFWERGGGCGGRNR